MQTRIILLVLAVAAGLALAACAPVGTPTSAPTRLPTTAPTSTPGDAATGVLSGTSWILVNLNGQAVLSDPLVTLDFENGQMAGADGCNRYSTAYTESGARLTVNPNILGTMMACPEPIMQQASAYLAALAQTAAYKLEGQQLTLVDAGGKTLATFALQSRALSGTDWSVTGYNNGQQAVVSVVIGSALTASFGADGKLSGSAGCNHYFAVYEVTGQSLQIGPAASTKKMCGEPAGVMEQEAQFLKALQTAATYRLDGNQLELRTADGALAATLAKAKPAGAVPALGRGPQNATYLIEGEAVTLVNGVAEKAAAPGSASKQVTRYFGNAEEIDLNADGQMDAAFLMVQDSGGSGTFYYVAAALNTAGTYVGTNAIFLGDRIAPQSTMIDPNNPAQFIVSYGQRPAGEPMSSEPTQMISRIFTLQGDELGEVK